MLTLHQRDPLARTLLETIHTGDIGSMQRLLDLNPGLANARIRDDKGGSRTPLLLVTDWPGHFPNGPATVAVLIAAGADPNLTTEGSTTVRETPLHWAASSDDVEVAAALIVGGADLEATGASIAGGTPLDDAVGYGCWQVARLLVERGARVKKLWHAAALGMMSRLQEFFTGPDTPSADEVNHAFWQACHGGKRRAAEYLLAQGADMNWIPDYAHQTPLEIAGATDTGREALITWLRDTGARPAAAVQQTSNDTAASDPASLT